MEKIRLTKGSLFEVSQQVGMQYLLELNVERLLAPIYEGSGLVPPKPSYGGWESMEIKGHSVGHYLSALASMYHETGELQLKQRLDYIVATLKRLQHQDGYVGGFSSQPFDQAFTGEFHVDNFSLNHYWVPWYSIHKIYAGLMDCYQLLGYQEALEVLIKLADWAVKGSSGMTDEQFQRMLICEYGGMNEVFAQLYEITHQTDYLDLAKRFTHLAILEPLIHQIDDLQGKHANTQIPKILGIAKLYEITKEIQYLNAVTFFFDTVVGNRSYVIGGNSASEHFGASRTEVLSREAAETCNTYNMMKLAEYLYRWTKESKYIDYYERALYNHILASQDPNTGCKIYFASNYPGHFKVYGTKEHSFWCCTGTGMENPGRYTRAIYLCDDMALYINLFIASTYESDEFSIRLETNFPSSEQVKLQIQKAPVVKKNIKIRIPSWIQSPVSVQYKGQTFKQLEAGYISIESVFHEGEEILITLPMCLHEYVSMDDEHKIAVMYGPIVLAASLGCDNFPKADIVSNHLSLMTQPIIRVPKLVTDENSIDQWVKLVNRETLTFQTTSIAQPGNQNLVLKPFYDIHHERYSIYLFKYTTSEYKKLGDENLTRDELLFDSTIDIVRTGEQQSEIEHQFKSIDSYAGYLADVNMWWRDARGVNGIFSYEMKVLINTSVSLLVSYYGLNGEQVESIDRTFDIFVNDHLLYQETLQGTKLPEIVDITYPIPNDFISGLEVDRDGYSKVIVTFKNTSAESVVGGVLEVRTIKNK